MTTLSGQLLLPLVLVKFLQKPVDVFFLQVVRRRQAQLVRVAPADADFVRLPHPVLQIHARDRRHVHADNGAAQRRLRRCPGFRTAFFHFRQDVVGKLAMTALDAVEPYVVRELQRSAQPAQRRQVRTADALKAFCANLGVVPAFGGNRVPQPIDHLGACSHLCGLEEYISQPNSCTLSRIIPITCAPSTAERMPLLRASAQSSFAGSTTPENVVMWLKKMTRVREVMASLNRFNKIG